MRRFVSRAASMASILLMAAVFLIIVGFSIADLAAITQGRVALLAEVLAVSFAACSAVASALAGMLAALARLQRRLGQGGPETKPARRRWLVLFGVLAWLAFVTAPFLGPSIVAGDWGETASLILMVGGVVIGFFLVIGLVALLVEARKRA